ncbi:MAG: flagellar filament capping protein FliD [Alkalibacterium sp.]|nr:flagellar filament capping protein FliD [Alkalibacterium sp.]
MWIKYNSTQKHITSQLDVGDPSAEDNKTGALAGDGTVMRLQSNLRRMMTKVNPGESPVKSLQDLGIKIEPRRNG